jgi:diguanylate cyclase (GGDEF)-like protein
VLARRPMGAPACNWLHPGDLLDGHRRHRDPDVVAAVIGLDDVKSGHDAQGHAAADRALVAIGHALRGASRLDAVIARTGGEEFVIVDLHPRSRIDDVSERIRAQVAAASPGVTASVGVASAR